MSWQFWAWSWLVGFVVFGFIGVCAAWYDNERADWRRGLLVYLCWPIAIMVVIGVVLWERLRDRAPRASSAIPRFLRF